MDLPIQVPLTRPVVVDDQTYDKLLIDEPDLDAQIAYAELEATFPAPKMVEQPDGSKRAVHSPILAGKVNRFWLARLSGVPEAVAGKIKSADLEAVNAAMDAVLGFSMANGNDAGGASGNVPPAK